LTRQALRAAKDRADDLAGMAAVAGINRAIALSFPAFRQVRNLDAVVVHPDPQAVVLYGAVGGDRLDLDSEGHLVGVHGFLFVSLAYPCVSTSPLERGEGKSGRISRNSACFCRLSARANVAGETTHQVQPKREMLSAGRFMVDRIPRRDGGSGIRLARAVRSSYNVVQSQRLVDCVGWQARKRCARG
jgi:hypothetical protein